MKLSNVLLIVGSLAVAGFFGWYMYMKSTPNYNRAVKRGLSADFEKQAGTKDKAPAASSNSKKEAQAKPKTAVKPAATPAPAAAANGAPKAAAPDAPAPADAAKEAEKGAGEKPTSP